MILNDKAIKEHVTALELELGNLKAQIAEKPAPPSLNDRVAELEIKQAKLWGLLIEQSRNGKDKLTKFGRKFGGLMRDSQ